MDYTKVYEHLDKLLAEDVLSLEVRDGLLPFRNVEDHKVIIDRPPPPNKYANHLFVFPNLDKKGNDQSCGQQQPG